MITLVSRKLIVLHYIYFVLFDYFSGEFQTIFVIFQHIFYVNQKTNTNAYICKLVKRNRNGSSKVLNSKLYLFRPFLIIFQESSISLYTYCVGLATRKTMRIWRSETQYLMTRKLIPSGKIVTLTPTGKRSLNLHFPRFI